MKKIIIITYIFSYNYGAFLQAKATQLMLEKLGFSSIFLDYCSNGEQRQVQRLMARDHIDESYAYTIINNQISSLKKREMADIVFDNNQGIEELYKQIDEFIERISHEEIINE